MSLSKEKIYKEFLYQMEWFYRNYGNKWRYEDFSKAIRNNIDKIQNLISFLEKKGFLQKIDNEEIVILKLPPKFEEVKDV